MRRDDRYRPELVTDARAGDQQARERLVADYLPLVYNIVGRALDGHADVDDVVQETMFRALDGLGGLRDPSRFRSWLVAIAMNQIRRRWTLQQQTATAPLDRVAETADPTGDFVDLTILRLGLSGQRREVAEATRWLDESDRELLALWWQEAAGQLSRAELAEALGVTPQHAAVRIQRMKTQLELGRVVARALANEPCCSALADVTAAWDGQPSPVWRKRIARHVRGCADCSGHWSDLVPAEGLLAGMAMVVPRDGYPPFPHGQFGAAGHGDFAGTGQPGDPAGGEGGGLGATGGLKVPAVVTAVGGVVVVGLLLALVWPTAKTPADRAPVAAPPAATAPKPTRSPSPTPTPSPTASAVPKPPKPSKPSPSPSAASLEERLTALVNSRRAEVGCAPLRIDPRLSAAARKHAKDMVARGYFDHADPEGRHADARISAAGYEVGPWAENLDQGPGEPKTVVGDWMDGSIHQENMLDCQYRDTGVAAVPGPDGTVWVQNLATPA